MERFLFYLPASGRLLSTPVPVQVLHPRNNRRPAYAPEALRSAVSGGGVWSGCDWQSSLQRARHPYSYIQALLPLWRDISHSQGPDEILQRPEPVN